MDKDKHGSLHYFPKVIKKNPLTRPIEDIKWWFDAKSLSGMIFRTMFVLVGLPINFFLSIVLELYSILAPLLIGSILFISYIIVNITIPLVSLSNSELNYVYYLTKPGRSSDEYFWLSSISTFVEDIPQLAMQLSYSIMSVQKYGQKVSVLQWVSMGFSIWKLSACLLMKYLQERSTQMDGSSGARIDLCGERL